MVAPTFLGQAVSSLTSYIKAASKGNTTLSGFFEVLALMSGFYVLNSVATFIAWIMMTKFNANANNDMRKGLFGKLQRMTIKYFDTHQDGQILSLFNSDLDNIFNALNNAFSEIISQGFLFFGTIAFMFVLNWKMAIAVVATTPFILMISFIIMKKARVYLDKQQDEIGSLTAYINEQLNGQNVILTQGLRQDSIAGFQEKTARCVKPCSRGNFTLESWTPS